MRLKSFRVQKFRNVLDSGEVVVDPGVTALVGKNESGKTAILEALYRFNPAYSDDDFSVIEHYPRWMEVRDRKSGEVEKARPITVEFELDEADTQAVAEVLGDGVINDTGLKVQVDYDGNRTVTVPCSYRQAIANICDRIGLSSTNRKRFEKAEDLADMKRIVEAWRAQVDAEGSNPPKALVDLEEEMSRTGNEVWREAWKVLKPRLPKFFYFHQYSQLPGRVDLSKLTDESDEPASSALQTARALLMLAGTETSMLADETYEVRKAELEAVSNELTSQVFDYWTQNPDLSVEMDVDKETQQQPDGQHAVARYLETRVKDRRHGYTNNFSQRSVGFQWFFSFLAAFSEFEDSESPVVVLLDEPALNLHGKAQADYLRFIDERLAVNHQVIYTTHSPFMVEPGRLNRVRIVEDHGPELGSVVSTSVLAKDPDSIFPLQAALGYDIAQSLFVGGNNLVVEGTSDFTYLSIIGRYLSGLGRRSLDDRWKITPVGGAQNIPTFVALLGSHLDVTVLIDSSSNSREVQRLNDMVATGLLDGSRLVTVGEVLEKKNADIEDLFSVEDYLELFNSGFTAQVKVPDLPSGDRVLNRLEEVRGAKFDHGVPAEILLRDQGPIVSSLSEETLSQFEALMVRINETLRSG